MEADEHLVFGNAINVYGAVDCHVLDAADSLHREPELLDLARLVGRDPRIVWLVVTPAANHQLKVRAVVVGENCVPHMRLREVAPEEELLSDRYVSVRDVRRAALFLVVVSSHERIVGVHAENRARFDCEVAPPRKIHRAGNVVGVLRALRGKQFDLLLARTDWEARPVVFVVVKSKAHRWRKENLVVVATVNRDIRPVDHRLYPRLAIHEDVLRFQDCPVREKRKPYRPLEAAAELRLANPYRLRAVLVRDKAPVDEHCRRRAVMMREVPLDAARNPRAEHPYERGLYDMLTVKRLKACLLVGEIEQVTSVLGEKPHLEPVVLERQVLVRLVDLLVVQHVLHRIRIDAPLRALVDAPRVEERRLVVAAWRVCRERYGPFVHFHLICVRRT